MDEYLKLLLKLDPGPVHNIYFLPMLRWLIDPIVDCFPNQQDKAGHEMLQVYLQHLMPSFVLLVGEAINNGINQPSEHGEKVYVMNRTWIKLQQQF